jgi:hypothetical protein
MCKVRESKAEPERVVVGERRGARAIFANASAGAGEAPRARCAGASRKARKQIATARDRAKRFILDSLAGPAMLVEQAKERS